MTAVLHKTCERGLQSVAFLREGANITLILHFTWFIEGQHAYRLLTLLQVVTQYSL